MFTLLKFFLTMSVCKLTCVESILIMQTFWDPNTYIVSFDSIVRRPDDDRISRSKHVASYTINNKKTVVLDVYLN